MHRFYIDGNGKYNDTITITGNDVNHIINVLRLNVGENIIICDGSKKEYSCSIVEINPKESVICKIYDVNDSFSELPVKIYLFQGLPKGDKMDLIIQKNVELGVFEIIPVLMERTIVKVEENKKKKRLERYNMISESAAKQSGRGIIPEVSSFKTFEESVFYAKENTDMIIVPYENADGINYSRQLIDKISEDSLSNKIRSIAVFIGPEGGFADKEIERLKMADSYIMTLGNRILRTETAGLAVMSILSFMLDK